MMLQVLCFADQRSGAFSYFVPGRCKVVVLLLLLLLLVLLDVQAVRVATVMATHVAATVYWQ